jgi:hypothetical protein
MAPDRSERSIIDTLVKLWMNTSVLRQVLASFLLSVMIVVTCYGLGRISDCSPHQIDGQCGLSTFMGIMSGAALGLGTFVAASIVIAIKWLRRRKQRLSDASGL